MVYDREVEIMVDFKKYVCLAHNKILNYDEAVEVFNDEGHEIIPFLISSDFDIPTNLFIRGSDGYYRLYIDNGTLITEKVELTED